MKGELLPGLSHSLELVEKKEEKQNLNTLHPEKTDKGQVSFQNARGQQIVRSRSVRSATDLSIFSRNANLASQSLLARPSGGKDRHSKVHTAKGLRDRRVRLSVSTAIQFYDVQDRLGYDQPSKAVDWLMKKAKTAIDELPPPDVRPKNNVAGTPFSARPPNLALESPSGFLSSSLASQQLKICFDSTASPSTDSRTAAGVSGISYHTSTSVPSESETQRQETQDLVPKFTATSRTSSAAWANSGKQAVERRMASVVSSFVGGIQAGHSSTKTESRANARERARQRAKDMISIKLEPLLADQMDRIRDSSMGVFSASSSPSSYENQNLASVFQNEDAISRLLRNNGHTSQKSQLQGQFQNQNQSYFKEIEGDMSNPEADNMQNNVISSDGSPVTIRMDLSPVSSQFARTYPSLFPDNPGEINLHRSCSQEYITQQTRIQGYITQQNIMPNYVDPAGSHTSSPRSSASLRSFPFAYKPSLTSNSSAIATSTEMNAAFGIPHNKNDMASARHSFTEQDDSSLLPFDKSQSAFSRTSTIIGAETGHQVRYNAQTSSLQRVERSSPQIKRTSSNEYGLLDEIMMPSDCAEAISRSFDLASGRRLQEQSQSMSGQFTGSHSASSNVPKDAYSTYYERESRNTPHQNLFRSSRTQYVPERLEGIFDELEEQVKRAS